MPSSPSQDRALDNVLGTISETEPTGISTSKEIDCVTKGGNNPMDGIGFFVEEMANKAKDHIGPKQHTTTSDSLLMSAGRPFADLVRTWETYMGDDAVDQFQPLLNNFCGAGQTFGRFGGPMALKNRTDVETPTNLSEPVPLRHIHSTPLVHIPSILDEDEDELPPIGLEILSRSRSTPLTTSVNSAFGTILRPNLPYIGGPCDRSAFTMPQYRLKPIQSQESTVRTTIFNPIQYENDLDTMEQTAIEVMDLPSLKPQEIREEASVEAKNSSRAARFLSDVRSIRRRRKTRDGRENPAQPVSVSEESRKQQEDISGDDETLSSKSSEHGAARKTSSNSADCDSSCNNDAESNKNASSHLPSACEGLGWDDDTRVRNASAVTSPVHRPLENENQTNHSGRVRIHVSNTKGQSILPNVNDRVSYTSSSPEPSNLGNDALSLTPQSHGSPETFRSSGTTFTSGHTTQGTATTISSGHVSNLSVISETDLEVMQANKAGNLLRTQVDQAGRVAPAPSTRQPLLPGYIELSDRPAFLREGASVPAERFFTLVESPIDKRGHAPRLRSSSSLRRSSTANSPNTVSSSSMTTSSSASSQDEPPRFVSYLDRKLSSDLTSLRETDERSSPCEGDRIREETESSPSELLGYSDCTFEEAQAPPLGSKARPRPIWPAKGFQLGRKVRSLPPRSPHKGSRTPTTPPPRGGGASPSYDTVSPPRHIVDDRIDPNVTRPYVFRSTPPSTRLLSAQKVSPEILTSHGSMNYATEQWGYEVVRMGTDFHLSSPTQPRCASPQSYYEQSIEVQKADSKEESSNIS